MKVEDHPYVKNALWIDRDLVVAPNKNPGSLYMLLQDKDPKSQKAAEKQYRQCMKEYNEAWAKSGVDFALQNYRVGDDPRYK
jgi:hypothetical protein